MYECYTYFKLDIIANTPKIEIKNMHGCYTYFKLDLIANIPIIKISYYDYDSNNYDFRDYYYYWTHKNYYNNFFNIFSLIANVLEKERRRIQKLKIRNENKYNKYKCKNIKRKMELYLF